MSGEDEEERTSTPTALSDSEEEVEDESSSSSEEDDDDWEQLPSHVRRNRIISLFDDDEDGGEGETDTEEESATKRCATSNWDEEDATLQMPIASATKLYHTNLNVFKGAYEGSRVFRIAKARDDPKKSERDRAMASFIDCDEIVEEIRRVAEDEETGLVHLMHLASLATDSVERAAQGACYFGSYVRLTIPKLSNVSARQLTAFLEEKKKTNEAAFIQIICKFYRYYAALPCARRSIYKQEICKKQKDKKRAFSKEVSTMKTVIRGVLCYLHMIAVIPASSPKCPDPLCKRIWTGLGTAQKMTSIEGKGPVKMDKWALTLVDLVELMKKSNGVSTAADLQSWLYGIVLAGVGLRPGSVKTARARAAEVHRIEVLYKKDEEKKSAPTQDFAEDDPSTTAGEELDGHHQDEEDDEEGVEIDFTGLRAKDVRVFLKAPQEGDRDVRLRVELIVRKDKVTGVKNFAFTTVGLHHPTSIAEEKEDWSPGAALALTLLCISAGTVDPDHISKKFAPAVGEHEVTVIGNRGENPIFCRPEVGCRGHLIAGEALVHEQPICERLLRTLDLPHSTYSSKSLRCGYAEKILTDYVARKKPNELIVRDDIRQALYTAGRWRSTQADTYIRHSLGNLDRYGSSVGGSTATDWMRTRYRTMACARTMSPAYRSYTLPDARQEMLKKKIKKPTKPELTELARLLTFRSFHKTLPLDKTDEQIRQFFLDRPVVNVRRAVRDYCTLMRVGIQRIPYNEITGNIFEDLEGPYLCVVEDCVEVCSTAEKINEHWRSRHHDTRFSKRWEVQYCCPCGKSRANWDGFRKHLREKHNFRQTDSHIFQWHMRSNEGEKTADEDAPVTEEAEVAEPFEKSSSSPSRLTDDVDQEDELLAADETMMTETFDSSAVWEGAGSSISSSTRMEEITSDSVCSLFSESFNASFGSSPALLATIHAAREKRRFSSSSSATTSDTNPRSPCLQDVTEVVPEKRRRQIFRTSSPLVKREDSPTPSTLSNPP